DSTPVELEPLGSGPGGDRVRVTFTPQDRYGNLVGPGAGPGASDGFTVTPLPGCTAVGGINDLGNGRYRQDLDCDPESEDPPGLSVTQPERDPVVLTPPVRDRIHYRYAAKLLCGQQSDDCCHCASLGAGRYSTAITLFNGSDKEAPVVQSIVPTTFSGAVSGRWPEDAGTRARDRITVAPHAATTIDCCSVNAMLLGAPTSGTLPVTLGMLVIDSPVALDVRAAYTVLTADGLSPSLEVESITPSEIRVRETLPAPPKPPAAVRAARTQPPPRPQDVAKPRKPKDGKDCDPPHDDPKESA
ncbi:MAG: hypothetical protein WBG92_07805, partial [Thiohalocapsa sp.]